jgi:hypothetical protein
MNGEQLSDGPSLELHIPAPRKAELQAKLSELGFAGYQQFAEACASLLLKEHFAFVHVVRAACHLEPAGPEMSWTEPGKDGDDDL